MKRKADRKNSLSQPHPTGNQMTAEPPRKTPISHKLSYSPHVENYLRDESSIILGHAEKVFFPRNEEEVSTVLQDGIKNRMQVTISGAGTGLTGARVPLGGYVISTEQLRKVPKAQRGENKISEGGSIIGHDILIGRDQEKGEHYAIIPPSLNLKSFQRALKGRKLYFPVNPTEDSATLGGMVSTNASGSHSFRHGPIRDWVRRIRIVLVDGGVLNIPRGLVYEKDGHYVISTLNGGRKLIPLPTHDMPSVRKNSAGYYAKKGMDLIDLFIGSEGTLGVISEIEVGLIKGEREVLDCIAFFPKPRDAIRFVKKIKALNHPLIRENHNPLEALSLEFYDHYSLQFLEKSPRTSLRIPDRSRAAVSFEHEVDEPHLDECLEQWDKILDDHHYTGSYIALSEGERERLREFRHSLPEAVNEFLRKRGKSKIATDIAVPEGSLDRMIEAYNETGFTALLDRIARKMGYKPGDAWEGLPARKKVDLLLENVNHCSKKALNNLDLTKKELSSLDLEDKIEILRKYFKVEIAFLYFGHIGDNHLHFNLLPVTEEEATAFKKLSIKLLIKGVRFGGTISAEHGVGKKTYNDDGGEKPFLELMYSQKNILSMAKVKNSLDPHHILNVGNLIPQKYLEEAALQE